MQTAAGAAAENIERAFETVHRCRHERYSEGMAGVVQKEARREIIGAVEHDGLTGDERTRVRRGEFTFVRDDLDGGIVQTQPGRCCQHLGCTDFGGGEKNLAVKIGKLDASCIDQCEPADASTCEIECRRTTESADANHEHACRRETRLTGFADFWQR